MTSSDEKFKVKSIAISREKHTVIRVINYVEVRLYIMQCTQTDIKPDSITICSFCTLRILNIKRSKIK